MEGRPLPELRPARATRDRHARHLFRLLLVLPALLLGAGTCRLCAPGGRLLDAGRPVYRRHRTCRSPSALLSVLHPGIEAMRLSRPSRAVCRTLHAGDGLPPDLSERGWEVALPGGGRDRRGGPLCRCGGGGGGFRAAPKEEQEE